MSIGTRNFARTHAVQATLRAAVLACCAALTLGVPAHSLVAQQVGYPPDQSPYRDIDWSQHLTLYGGYYHAGKDEIGAAPASAPMLGLRYEVDIAGPAQFFVRAARVNSERNAVDPSLPAATRSLGKVSDPLYLADAGFSFNLTGRKSWHSLVPVFGFALGVASATSTEPKDPYRFGTQFAFSTQFGIRYIPNRHYELRAMIDNIFYQNHYPAGYYQKTADTTSVLTSSTGRSSYLANTALTVGLSVPLFR